MPNKWPQAKQEDVVSIDTLIDALYDSISSPAGVCNWDRLRSLFLPHSRIIPVRIGENGAPFTDAMSVDDFVARVDKSRRTKGFFERELYRKVETFGCISQVFSTYESRYDPNDEAPFARGINSIQLFFDQTRYAVLSVFWDVEREGNPIPSSYLP